MLYALSPGWHALCILEEALLHGFASFTSVPPRHLRFCHILLLLKRRLRALLVLDDPFFAKLRGDIAHAPRRTDGTSKRKLKRKNETLQNWYPSKREVRLPAPAIDMVRGRRGIGGTKGGERGQREKEEEKPPEEEDAASCGR
jgi:hypothetical protein